eukprot:Blabericola_migrator_1__1776@NODE_147_length_12949_cov_102_817264_g128_i0_p6_GENE_NODE_147_length_12949_cov_102_817264_g128_i0NODE_147_length_12949_cov_102_817264_g128_i0_p6_ORF_typecomplete_len163_score30_91_NODE_147_length_12949_cov_102_817264_g128_i060006488
MSIVEIIRKLCCCESASRKQSTPNPVAQAHPSNVIRLGPQAAAAPPTSIEGPSDARTMNPDQLLRALNSSQQPISHMQLANSYIKAAYRTVDQTTSDDVVEGKLEALKDTQEMKALCELFHQRPTNETKEQVVSLSCMLAAKIYNELGGSLEDIEGEEAVDA